MAYDYYMPTWWNHTAAFAALYNPGSDMSTDYGISSWINCGFPAKKLVLGLPFYGYAWTLVNPNDNEIGALAKGPAITRDGAMTYKDIKDVIPIFFHSFYTEFFKFLPNIKRKQNKIKLNIK